MGKKIVLFVLKIAERSSDKELLTNSKKTTKLYNDKQTVSTVFPSFWSFCVNLKVFFCSCPKPRSFQRLEDF